MFKYTKTKHYSDKAINYTDSNNETVVLFYEDDDILGDLLHKDDKFAELTIAVHEAMNGNPVVKFTHYNNDDKTVWADLRAYVNSINPAWNHVGSWNCSTAE